MTFTFRFPILLALLFLSLPVPAWADYLKGFEAYKRGDYDTAFKECWSSSPSSSAEPVVGDAQ